jgi:serine/threonine protein kinase
MYIYGTGSIWGQAVALKTLRITKGYQPSQLEFQKEVKIMRTLRHPNIVEFLGMLVSLYVCMYGFMYVCIYVCMYVCMHVCMYACMYLYMYISVIDDTKPMEIINVSNI